MVTAPSAPRGRVRDTDRDTEVPPRLDRRIEGHRGTGFGKPGHTGAMNTTKERIETIDQLVETKRGTLSPAEVAAVVGVDHRTIYRAIEDGQLPCIELGKLKRIPRVHVIKMLGLDAA